jgi:hypothetical protein
MVFHKSKAMITSEWTSEFSFKGKQLLYNRIPYNNPTERAVEIPVALDFLANIANKGNILEIGNVLTYYENSLGKLLGIHSRRIIDKFEIDLDVENLDLMDLASDQKFNTIISISTVEHVGQSSEPSGSYGENLEVRDLEAPLKAIAKIYDLLEVDGKALITVPFGVLTDGIWYIQFSEQYLTLLAKFAIPPHAISARFLKLVNRDASWQQVRVLWSELEGLELSNVEYGYPFACANAIAVIELSKLSHDFQLNLNIEPTHLVYSNPYETRT